MSIEFVYLPRVDAEDKDAHILLKVLPKKGSPIFVDPATLYVFEVTQGKYAGVKLANAPIDDIVDYLYSLPS